MTTPEQPERPPMPEQPKTTSLPAVTDRALLEDLGRVVRNMADNVGSMRQDVSTLMEDRPVLHSRLAGVEGRLARIESPTTPPPPPLTSERVRALVAIPSQVDLDEQAKLAAVIVETSELKTAIRETRTLASLAATKDDLQRLSDGTATKAEVKAIADAQTVDIVTRVTALADKSPTIRLLLVAFAGLLFAALSSATTYVATRNNAQPQLPQQGVAK